MSGNRMCYAGRCKCGRIVALALITDDNERMARILQEWARDGIRVEQMTVNQGRAEFYYCECEPEQERLL